MFSLRWASIQCSSQFSYLTRNDFIFFTLCSPFQQQGIGKTQVLIRGCNTVRFNIRLNKMLKLVQLIDAFQATSNFNVLSLFVASCEQVDVGVSWYILDNQLNASSELNASTPAKNGRLNFVAGSSWCASTSDSSPYLQIDLQIPYIICAVSTQGNSQGSQWVESYTLQSSTDGTTWTGYKENGQVKVVEVKGCIQ